MTLKLIVFGAIGTIVETSEYQRRSFNMAFQNSGIDWVWNIAEYIGMLSIQGGKSRIEAYASKHGPELSEEQIAKVYSDKSRFFQDMIRANGLVPRPGIQELMKSAKAKTIKVVFASDTSLKNISAIFDALGDSIRREDFDFVTDGSMVKDHRPAPDVYNLLIEKFGVLKTEVVAIEDTATNMLSAVNAGITSVAYPGKYSSHQDFSAGTAVATNDRIFDLTWIESLLSVPN